MTQEEKAKAYDNVRKKIAIRFGSKVAEEIFSQFEMSEDERIRKALLNEFIHLQSNGYKFAGLEGEDILAWLEKQSINPYSGTSFEYNGHTWGMCARDNGVDILCDKHIIGHLEKQGKQKSSWSEEDESYLNTMIAYLKDAKEFKKTAENCIDWLKSLKDRVQPKQEWSEEDESRITTICTYLQDYARLSGSESRTIRINEYCDWLKSLKPQNRWKPSDEQMQLLKELVEDNNQRYFYTTLRSLYEQLKSLKGE